MTSHENETDVENVDVDVTLPAGSDVVAQIRAHAAKVRSGEIAAHEEIRVWTPTAAEPEIADAEIADAENTEPEASSDQGQRFAGAGERVLLPNDDTVPFGAPARGESLDELGPTKASADFWGPDRRFDEGGAESKSQRVLLASVPQWAWVAAAALVILIAALVVV